jgi:hypothetical protein
MMLATNRDCAFFFNDTLEKVAPQDSVAEREGLCGSSVAGGGPQRLLR